MPAKLESCFHGITMLLMRAPSKSGVTKKPKKDTGISSNYLLSLNSTTVGGTASQFLFYTKKLIIFGRTIASA